MPTPKYLYTCNTTGYEYWDICGKVVAIKSK